MRRYRPAGCFRRLNGSAMVLARRTTTIGRVLRRLDGFYVGDDYQVDFPTLLSNIWLNLRLMSIKFYRNRPNSLTLTFIKNRLFAELFYSKNDVYINEIIEIEKYNNEIKFVSLFNKNETSQALISDIVSFDDGDADFGPHVGNQAIAGCKR